MNKIPGRNWILLRGLARESAHWGNFVPLLQASYPKANITLLDLPGTGCFHREASPNTIQAITDQVRGLALANGLVRQPVTMLALSLGGMVTWDWMLRYPDDICGAAIMNTSFAELNPFYLRLRWQCYKKIARIITTRDTYKKELGILQLVSNRQDQHETVSQLWLKIQNERPISLRNSMLQIMAAARYRSGDAKPTQPVLLLNAQGDRLVSPACSEAIHQKWRLELRSHPWAGHDLPLDDGEWVVEQLKEWVVKA